jgi:hypothetical protein
VDGQPLQANLAISEPGDEKEQQANHPLDDAKHASAKPIFGHHFSQIRPSQTRSESTLTTKAFNSRREIPLELWPDLGKGAGSSKIEDTIGTLPHGRPLSLSLRKRLSHAPQSVLDGVQVHDDTQSRITADLLNSEALAYKKHIILGSMAQDTNWLTAHELGHVLQQCLPTPSKSPADASFLEHEADQFADAMSGTTESSKDQALTLSPASPGLARKVIWKSIQNLPGDLLLILDVDDGDFVGGCVRAIVPHVGVKLIKKAPHMQLFNLHVGFLTNPAGEYCIFFYESVTGVCETLCYSSKQKLREDWEKVKEWLRQMMENVLKALAIVALLAMLAYLAYLMAAAIAAALLILLAA